MMLNQIYHPISRYMGTVVGISDLDHLRWPNSKWCNLQVNEGVFGILNALPIPRALVSFSQC